LHAVVTKPGGVVELRLTAVESEGRMHVHGPIVRERSPVPFGPMCRGRLRRDVLLLLICAVTAVFVPSGRATAHTDLDFTLPAEGTTVGEPVREISIGFTAAVRLVGNGFEVLDPQGNLLYPFAVTDDDMVFRLQLDPPLAGGPVSVRYEVASMDGHILEGSFTFTAAAAPPPSTTASATTVPRTAPPSSAPASTTVVVSSQAATTLVAPTTVAATAISAETLPTTTTGTSDQSSDDSDRTMLVVALVAVAAGAAGFVFVRSRRSSRS
jgi:methionine-rich copper-binding protein CopC